MKRIKNPSKLYIPGFEPWRGYLTEKKVDLLEKSWAGVFRKYVTPKLPVKKLGEHYSDNMGRPSKELTTVLGAVVLQQIFDLTDAETRDQLAFNQQWHYALDMFNQTDQLLCLKTLWTVRNNLVESGSDKEIFDSATDNFSVALCVDNSLQRIDSVHIHSNMARLGRVRLLSRVIHIFLKNLRRHHSEKYKSVITSELQERYEKKDSAGYFGDVKPTESRKRLIDIGKDLYFLLTRFSDDGDVTNMYSYKLLGRVFGEHYKVDNEGEVTILPAKNVSSGSLQNPSDPDAAYDSHKGQGYQVQIMESYSRKDDNDGAEEPALNLITYAKVEPANVHDSGALEPALDDVEMRSLLPEEVAADTHYGSEDNKKMAKAKGVELIAPLPGKKSKKDFREFEFDRKSLEVIECPNGKKPDEIKHNKKGSITATWFFGQCFYCHYAGDCPTRIGSKGRCLHYTRKEIQLWFRREYEESKEFKDKYRYRAGIEGTNSRFIGMTGARRLRYRGLGRVRFAGILKVLGVNLFRVTRYIQQTGKKPTQTVVLQAINAFSSFAFSIFNRILDLISVFKEDENRTIKIAFV